MRKVLLLFLLSILTYSPFAQKVFKVPSEYPTIQAGIDAAWDGDTVLIADGEYSGEGNCSIRFKGKRIVVKSEKGPDSCTIILDNDIPSSHAYGFIFTGYEDSMSVLEGIEIEAIETNGSTFAINGEYSSPKIINCNFNKTGAAFSNCSPLVYDCLFHDAPYYGGGIRITGNSTTSIYIKNCTFKNNHINYDGGAIELISINSFIEISNYANQELKTI